MLVALKLTHDEPRLLFLALVYHLGRPGSELDPTSKLPIEHGLREVKVRLGNQLFEKSAVVELDDFQFRRLLSAVYGSVNELRLYHMGNGAPSTVARFTSTAEELFPAIVADPGVALDIAEAMMMLHRRLERAIAQAHAGASEPAAAPRRRRWPFRS